MWVAEIWRYAVESMGGEPLKEALLPTTKGIDGDRVVQVWARTGRFFTARTRPKLLHHWATLSTEGLPLVDGRPYPIP